MENASYSNDDEEQEALEGCEEECEEELRNNFDCTRFLADYYSDDPEDSPLWMDYVDTRRVQRVKKDGTSYNKILNNRISEIGDSGKFIKKVSSVF